MSYLQPARPTATGALRYADWSGAAWIYMIGDCIAIPFGAAVTAGQFEFMLIEAHAGGGPPLHTHPEAEVFVILAGAFEFTSYVDGQLTTLVATASDALHAPGGVPHTFKCVSAEGGTCLAFILPAGREQFFHEAGVALTPENRAAALAAPPDFERIMAAAQRSGLALWDPATPWTGASAAYFPAADARTQSRRIAGEVFHLAACVEHAQGGLLVADCTSQPGAAVPMHCHAQPEVFYCVDGAYRFGTLDDHGAEVWFDLPAGAMLYLPPGVPHAFGNPAGTSARCLAFFQGTAIRSFFELGTPVADPLAAAATPYQPDTAELGKLLADAARCGMTF